MGIQEPGSPVDRRTNEQETPLISNRIAVHVYNMKQVQRLEESVKDLQPQLGRTEALAEDLKQQVEILASGLQGDRRSIARGVNAIWKQQQQARERQRGPERDFGPSR